MNIYCVLVTDEQEPELKLPEGSQFLKFPFPAEDLRSFEKMQTNCNILAASLYRYFNPDVVRAEPASDPGLQTPLEEVKND